MALNNVQTKIGKKGRYRKLLNDEGKHDKTTPATWENKIWFILFLVFPIIRPMGEQKK